MKYRAGLIGLTLAAAMALIGSPATADTTTQATYVKNAKVTNSSPPSSAICRDIINTSTMGSVGTVCFEAHGDVFWLNDRKADGASIRAVGETYANFGCNATAGSSAGWQYCSFSTEMREGVTLYFMGYAVKNGSVLHTSEEVFVNN
ncbi:hypothetical protein [Streptomyces profundus]|uniref:hypothetical protein n=1 Tax=Streptomyces profundus TaxID=2867410 RepID=UPI001D169B18|nr:hypothetical protein [Streptomyces sp. MA3_2.13]UED88167.1 hypothetical protein K4G22_31465 [Streptomyces sp. MA3_2.13]